MLNWNKLFKFFGECLWAVFSAASCTIEAMLCRLPPLTLSSWLSPDHSSRQVESACNLESDASLRRRCIPISSIRKESPDIQTNDSYNQRSEPWQSSTPATVSFVRRRACFFLDRRRCARSLVDPKRQAEESCSLYVLESRIFFREPTSGRSIHEELVCLLAYSSSSLRLYPS